MEKVIRVAEAEAEPLFEELMDGVLRGEGRWLIVREDGVEVEVVRKRWKDDG